MKIKKPTNHISMNATTKKVFKTEFAGRPLEFEVGELAFRATKAVLGRYGDTEVLVTVVMGELDTNLDYMPLTVDFEERFYAIGKILGSRYTRREGKSSDEAVLSGRVIDRTIRPLFDQRLRREIQVVVTTLALDGENDHNFLSLVTASLALHLSSIPWQGPVAGVNLAEVDNKILVNPKNSESVENTFEGFISGPKGRINMIEIEGLNAHEEKILTAFKAGQEAIDSLIDFQESIRKEIGDKKIDAVLASSNADLKKEIKEKLGNDLEAALFLGKRDASEKGVKELLVNLIKSYEDNGADEKSIKELSHIFEELSDELVHQNALEKNLRPDNRGFEEIRPLEGKVSVIKRAHGSALFTRGETQSLAVVTLASPDSEKIVESIEGIQNKSFMLHYNFPPYSTGEVGRMRGPGRREIGHGSLAEKALRRLIPKKELFPYIIRIVSEILSSNGSSSMASVCAGTLAMMDAGIPLLAPAAGIAIGLMSNEKGDYKILTDIQGAEDHYGDMDFKVAGTETGITAIQLDTKVSGITLNTIKDALEAGKKARKEILETIISTISAPRAALSPFAPSVFSVSINPDKIGLLIGPGGKTINSIIADTGIDNIDVNQDGKIYVYASNQEKGWRARERIEQLTKDYSIGDIVTGKIVRIFEFGAILEFAPGKDGMIHVSELKDGFVKKVEDVVKLGEEVTAKIVKMEGDKIGLSLKALKK
ncbi:MAG: polyribonucleotide nucleotidyltransferase [Candidatus Harrisonbacteria bacterium]|nr:polyribonucleotide nucleotidyltransferase [Candidatus Harrisonbacteria bacterium]